MVSPTPRRVLVLGASGLIGSAICREALRHPSLQCIPASREAREGFLSIPYSKLTRPEDWVALLQEHDIESVVNCIGLWKGSKEVFERIQFEVPTALGRACAHLKLHLVHVSALGFRESSPLPYVSTKPRADKFIYDNVPGSTIVYPSLVFGPSGQSTRFFLQLAALPVHADLGYPQNLQPVHVEDVARAVVASLRGEIRERRIECAGQSRITVSEYLAHLRQGMGLGRPRLTIAMPKSVTRAMFSFGDKLGSQFVNKQTFALLADGTCSKDDQPHVRPYENYATPAEFTQVKGARLRMATRLGMGTLWLGTAIGTWWFWPRDDALNMLAQMHPALATTGSLAASCLLDASMGLASFFLPSKRLWKLQFWLTLGYTAGLVFAMPVGLAHPLGLLLKNLCVLAAQAYLALTEEK
jgi:uncharacterized protein YbjT (DUF2867 family)